MHFIPENCQLQTILYILRVAPATFEWQPFCPWQTLKRIKMWRDLHIPSLWILLQTHRDPFVLNNLVNGQPLLWVGLQAALARKVCQTLQEQISLSNVTLDCNIVINTVIVIVSKDQIIRLSD